MTVDLDPEGIEAAAEAVCDYEMQFFPHERTPRATARAASPPT